MLFLEQLAVASWAKNSFAIFHAARDNYAYNLNDILKVKTKVIQLIWRPLVKESHCRNARVWHALSRDFTVLPALQTRAFIHQWNAPYLPLLFELKLVLI